MKKNVSQNNNKKNIKFDVLSWQEARDNFAKVKPELADIIDTWQPSPDKGYKLIKVDYPFGAHILKNGTIHFPAEDPNSHHSVPIDNDSVPEYLKDALGYSSVPMSLLVNNGSEVFLENEGMINMLTFFKPGNIIGLWESLKTSVPHFPTKIWDIVAGARSIYMLPKISDHTYHEKLCRSTNIKSPTPKNLFSHWHVFRDIAQNYNGKKNWHHTIFFFTKEWLEPLLTNPNWVRFHHSLLEEAWETTTYSRSQLANNIVLNHFAKIASEQFFKVQINLIDVLKHLIGIAIGALPGFTPNQNETDAGPIDLIQKDYVEHYKLSYLPTVMRPSYLNHDSNGNTIYYPLQFPTLFTSSLQTQKHSTMLADMRKLKLLWEFFIEMAMENKLALENTFFEIIADNINIDFFHTEEDERHEILSTNTIVKDDPRLFAAPKPILAKKLPFATASPFLRGCVRIKKINDDYQPSFA